MGGGSGGGYSAAGGSLKENLKPLAEKYGVTPGGKFASPGQGKSRHIYSDDPLSEAQSFFNQAKLGGTEEPLENGRGTISKFRDGSEVKFRPKSKDGSPSVEITLTGPGGRYQKIHFVKSK
jgi:hypothetical protein